MRVEVTIQKLKSEIARVEALPDSYGKTLRLEFLADELSRAQAFKTEYIFDC